MGTGEKRAPGLHHARSAWLIAPPRTTPRRGRFSRLNYSRTRIYLYTSCIVRIVGSGNQTNNTQAFLRLNRTDYRFFGVDIFVSLYLNGRGRLKFYGFFYPVLKIECEYFDDRVQFRDSEYRVFCSPSTRIVGRVRVLRHSSTSTSTLKMVLE